MPAMKLLALITLPFVLTACGDRPKDVPPPAKAPSAAPATGGELPAGHPPVEAAGDPHAGHDHGAADPGKPIAGTVEASPKVKDKVAGAQALFVIARKAGARDIVAVKKMDAAALPQSFTISGADAMVAGTPFEGTIDLTARLSRAGDAIPGPGDIEGVKTGVAAGTSGVTIVLETIRP